MKFLQKVKLFFKRKSSLPFYNAISLESYIKLNPLFNGFLSFVSKYSRIIIKSVVYIENKNIFYITCQDRDFNTNCISGKLTIKDFLEYIEILKIEFIPYDLLIEACPIFITSRKLSEVMEIDEKSHVTIFYENNILFEYEEAGLIKVTENLPFIIKEEKLSSKIDLTLYPISKLRIQEVKN